MDSSSVRMTRTLVALASVEINGAPAELHIGSSAIPRNSSPSQVRRRISPKFSPMPLESGSSPNRVGNKSCLMASKPLDFKGFLASPQYRNLGGFWEA